MIKFFTTVSGSEYLLDSETMTWKRSRKSDASGMIRGETGKLTHWPEIAIGQGALLQDESVLEGCIAHAVYTSDVVKITEVDDATLG